jgi:SAM-dependent methyltransferase
MHILVNAANVTASGPRALLLSLLPALSQVAPHSRFTFLFICHERYHDLFLESEEAFVNLPSGKYTTHDYLRHNPTWDIEDSTWKSDKVTAMLAAVSCKPSSICEVGCGAGGVLAKLRRAYPETELFGYDIASDAARFWSEHVSANIHFEIGDFFELSERTYDVLLLLDVIEHLQDPFDFVTRLRNYASLFVFHFPIDLSAVTVLREQPLLSSRLKVGHIHYFTKGLALALLEECDYHILDWHYTGAAFTSPKRTWKTRLASLPRRMAYAVNKDWGVRLLGGEHLWCWSVPEDEYGACH